MLMSRLYINITTTSYCADPKKVVPVFGLDAKFGNNSILGYQISPNYVIFLQAVLLLLREIEGNRQSLSLNYLKLDYSLKLHLKLNLVILISNIYNWKWHYKIYLIPLLSTLFTQFSPDEIYTQNKRVPNNTLGYFFP